MPVCVLVSPRGVYDLELPASVAVSVFVCVRAHV